MEQYTIIKSAFMLMALVGAFACLIIVTFQLINAYQTQLPIEPGSYDHKGVFPVSEKLVGFFSLDTLSPWQVFAGYEVAYWIHVVTILYGNPDQVSPIVRRENCFKRQPAATG